MNYGQALEHLKDFGTGPVFLMGADGPYSISMAMADETGVYLVTEHAEYLAAETHDSVTLLAALRDLEPQPEFTAAVFADGPEGTGSIERVLVSEGGTLTFEAPGIHLHRDQVALDGEQHSGGSTLIHHDFEAVPGFEKGGPEGSPALCFHCDQRADAPVHQAPAAPRPLSPPAAGVLNAIGLGMRLRVPHDGGGAMLNDSTDQGRESLGPVNPDHVQELLASGHLAKLTKDRNGSRMGWAEKGLDGDAADFYCCVQ